MAKVKHLSRRLKGKMAKIPFIQENELSLVSLICIQISSDEPMRSEFQRCPEFRCRNSNKCHRNSQWPFAQRLTSWIFVFIQKRMNIICSCWLSLLEDMRQIIKLHHSITGISFPSFCNYPFMTDSAIKPKQTCSGQTIIPLHYWSLKSEGNVFSLSLSLFFLLLDSHKLLYAFAFHLSEATWWSRCLFHHMHYGKSTAALMAF